MIEVVGGIKFIIIFKGMAEKQDQTPIKEITSEVISEAYQLHYNNYQEEESQCDFDLEEQYFEKLKEQRKRIEELSSLHQNYEERLEKQLGKNKILREEIEKLSSFKDYQVRYNETITNFQIISQENKALKEHNQELKLKIYQSQFDKTGLIQKLKLEVSLLRDKQSQKIQSLQQELQNRQQQIDKLIRDSRGKEKEYQELISSLKIKFCNLENQKDQLIRTEQRKVEKLEKELVHKSQSFSQSQLNNESLLKEHNRLKQESHRLNGLLNSKDMELKSLSQKYKKHMISSRKQSANKDKECQQLKQSLRKHEKEAKESVSESEILKIEIRKTKENFQLEKIRWEADFSRERKDMQATIIQHTRTIEQLLEIKNNLMAEKLKLQTILKKKTDCENKRLTFLKSQWKEINKLEKVIDKIID